MIFLSEQIARVDLRLYVDEAVPRGSLIRLASGELQLEPGDTPGPDLQRMEQWLSDAGLHVIDRRRRGRRWTLRASLQGEP